MCFSQVGFQIGTSHYVSGRQMCHLVSTNSKTFQSQGDYLELAARVKELEHKVEPRWDFIKTFTIGKLNESIYGTSLVVTHFNF